MFWFFFYLFTWIYVVTVFKDYISNMGVNKIIHKKFGAGGGSSQQAPVVESHSKGKA